MALTDQKLIEICEKIGRAKSLPLVMAEVVPVMLSSIENESERFRIAMIFLEYSIKGIEEIKKTLEENENAKKN